MSFEEQSSKYRQIPEIVEKCLIEWSNSYTKSNAIKNFRDLANDSFLLDLVGRVPGFKLKDTIYTSQHLFISDQLHNLKIIGKSIVDYYQVHLLRDVSNMKWDYSQILKDNNQELLRFILPILGMLHLKTNLLQQLQIPTNYADTFLILIQNATQVPQITPNNNQSQLLQLTDHLENVEQQLQTAHLQIQTLQAQNINFRIQISTLQSAQQQLRHQLMRESHQKQQLSLLIQKYQSQLKCQEIHDSIWREKYHQMITFKQQEIQESHRIIKSLKESIASDKAEAYKTELYQENIRQLQGSICLMQKFHQQQKSIIQSLEKQLFSQREQNQHLISQKTQLTIQLQNYKCNQYPKIADQSLNQFSIVSNSDDSLWQNKENLAFIANEHEPNYQILNTILKDNYQKFNQNQNISKFITAFQNQQTDNNLLKIINSLQQNHRQEINLLIQVIIQLNTTLKLANNSKILKNNDNKRLSKFKQIISVMLSQSEQ